ncbi:Uncharacterised protein [Sphingobacterium daejeonense]|nr:Uncharacterised protein [Sphingobacterium daejeonense]
MAEILQYLVRLYFSFRQAQMGIFVCLPIDKKMKEVSCFSTSPSSGKVHRCDIGRPLFWRKGPSDGHFLNTLYRIDEDEFADFYSLHPGNFRKTNDNSDGKALDYYKKGSVL